MTPSGPPLAQVPRRTPIRVLVADDHTLVRQGLVGLLEASGECSVVAQAADGVEAVAEAHRTQPEVAVLDLGMPHLSGLEAARRIHSELPAVRILVLTVHDEQEYVLHVVRAGAAGYLVKDSAAAELLAAVRALAAGQGYFGPQAARALAEQLRSPEESADPYGPLTAREREVFHLVIEGRTTKEVARALGISVKTAENHRSRILDKLGLHNAAELVLYASRKGLLG
jgi:DNA-binding NarL/FixJ family response regulator